MPTNIIVPVNEDFSPILNNFIVLAQEENLRRQCVDVPILDDDIPEPNEMFRVVLVRDPFTSPNVVFSRGSAVVVIVDDDRSKMTEYTM